MLRRDPRIQNTQNNDFFRGRQKTWNIKGQLNSGWDDSSNNGLSNLDDILEENEKNLKQDPHWNMDQVENKSISNSNNSDINHKFKNKICKNIKRNKNLIGLKDAKSRSQSTALYQNMLRCQGRFQNNFINKNSSFGEESKSNRSFNEGILLV